MKILVTGSNGFIGRNLVAELKNKKYEVLEYDRHCSLSLLDEFCREAQFVYHLAGINRPESDSEFMEGNFGFTTHLLDSLKKHENRSPVMLSSSIQAALENPYGISKKAGEDYLKAYGFENDVEVYVYRLPNVFGKWSQPNYNSVIATFCHNIAHDLPIQVNDPEVKLVQKQHHRCTLNSI